MPNGGELGITWQSHGSSGKIRKRQRSKERIALCAKKPATPWQMQRKMID
jgi:hypothetical protein